MSSELISPEGEDLAADCAALLKIVEPLAREFEINRQEQEQDEGKIGFNLFELISRHYYRETFHSDIIKALLDPREKHEAANIYLELFLKFLISKHAAKIETSHYLDAEVEREEGRMDILIKGRHDDSDGLKHAIIIENKINGASDRTTQLPDYYKKVNR